MSKITKIIAGAAIGIMLAATVTTTVFSVIVYATVKENEKRDKEKEDEAEAAAGDTENVLIGSQYQILSTKNISDAYLSGDSSDLNDEDKKTLEVASNILDEIIEEDMSDYEKEEAIYLWMVENVSTDGKGSAVANNAAGIVDRPYGVLQNKEAVCVGFATSFRLLANMAGLDCMIMHDTSLSHSWDLVKLDDGCWYIVDCYFDSDSEASYYSHFNMSAQIALQDHDWDSSLYPVANGTQYCYAEMNKVEVKDLDELLSKISEDLENDKSKDFFEIKSDDATYEELSYITDGISERVMSDTTYSEFRILQNEDKSYMIIFSYIDYNNQGEDDYEDLDYEALDKLLNDTFGEVAYDYEHWGYDYNEEAVVDEEEIVNE